MEVLKKTNDMDVNNQTVVIPFELSCNPMKKLAIINFEKLPDIVYVGLELQYFDGDNYGKGYRVIAYRCDGYIDVYDDINLNYIEDENFDVAGKGLCERVRVVIENTVLQKEDGCIQISFKFVDKIGRTIVAKISEQTTQKTKGMNLLAPIGDSTENPSYLPLFFLYDFDFVRKHKTNVELKIDGKRIRQDNFPIPAPKDFQRRYYSRYTLDCQIIEFAKATNCIIDKVIPNSSGLVVRGPLEYQFNNGLLRKIILKHSSHPLAVEFGHGFPDVRYLSDDTEYMDTFKIIADDSMGFVAGKYSIKREQESVKIELIPSDGWSAVPNSFLTKMLFGKRSIFCSWPKTYRYIQKIDIVTLNSVSYWERIK